jgi:hypothetical protein
MLARTRGDDARIGFGMSRRCRAFFSAETEHVGSGFPHGRNQFFRIGLRHGVAQTDAAVAVVEPDADGFFGFSSGALKAKVANLGEIILGDHHQRAEPRHFDQAPVDQPRGFSYRGEAETSALRV